MRDSVNREPWERTMELAYEDLNSNPTFVHAKLPKGQKTVRAKWIHRWKIKQHGKVNQANARLGDLGNL